MSGYIFMDWKFPESMKDFDYSVLNSAFVKADIPHIYIKDGVYKSTDVFVAEYCEFENLPIYKFHLAWINLIRNNSWDNRSKYYAELRYYTTLMDGQTVQYEQVYKDVYPLAIPTDAFGHTVSKVDSVKLHIPYHVEFENFSIKD